MQHPIGLIALSALASYVRDWRELTRITTWIGIPMLVSAWFLLESPRWFLTKGKFHLANAVLRRIAEGTFELSGFYDLNLMPFFTRNRQWNTVQTRV